MLTDRERARTGPRSMKTPGSPEWCWQTLDFFKNALRHVDEQYRQAEEVLDELRQVKAWEKVPPESPYGSFDAMLKAETGMSAQQLRTQIKTAKEKYGAQRPVRANGGDRRSDEFQGDSVPLKRGNSPEYVVATLKRDAETDPHAADLLSQVMDDKITPNAAAVQAGIRKKKVEIRPGDPQLVANQLRKHMSPEQIVNLIALLLPGGLDSALRASTTPEETP